MLISTILSEKREIRSLVYIAGTIVVLALAPAVVSASLLITLITVLMYATLTLSWTMFSGSTRYISLATAALFGVGVYASALLRDSLPIELIVLVGGAVAAVLALAIGLLTLRLKGVYFILFTFGVTALIRNAFQWWETHMVGTVGRHIEGASNGVVYLLVTIIFALALLASYLLRNSSAGMALRGIGENQDAAEHSGIHLTRLKVLTFAGSAVFMGATGAVMATRFRYIDPSIAFNPLISFLPVVMAIFGGIARLYGPILGTLVLIVLQEFLITEHPYVYLLIFGLTLIVVVLWLPGGLVEQVEKGVFRMKIEWMKLRMRWKRWRAA
ncbi:MAG: branched-chain amino acid ABC transporter permease [Actinobacteria bacterium]|nr:MAG: branched-chain amino acid ABC transporter permease [Actinomycetota bacterium]